MNEADRILATILKAMLAGPQPGVWEIAALMCAAAAVAAADRATTPPETGHAVLLAAAAVICGDNAPEAGDDIRQATLHSVRCARNARRRLLPAAQTAAEVHWNPEDDEDLERLTAARLEEAVNPPPQERPMTTFEPYREAAEAALRRMLDPAANPIADPEFHGEDAFGAAGRQYRNKALRALNLAARLEAAAGPAGWREVTELLRQCAAHADETVKTRVLESHCQAAARTSGEAVIAAEKAAAWLEGHHSPPSP